MTEILREIQKENFCSHHGCLTFLAAIYSNFVESYQIDVSESEPES